MALGWLTLGLVVAALVLLYRWASRNHDYWAKRGIPFVPPSLLVGSMGPVLMRKKNPAIVFQGVYEELKVHKIGGYFEFANPLLMVCDPDLIKEITVKHFDHFSDRRILLGRGTDPLLARSLPSLKGGEWRAMRNRLSPAFTTSKLRNMFPLITRCGEQFARFLVQEQRGEPLEFKATFSRLTNDVIASVAYGVEGGAIKDPNTKFYRFVQTLTQFKGLRGLILIGYALVPWLMELLSISVFPPEVTTYFKGLVGDAMAHRKKTGESRSDMLQLLMEAQAGEISRTHGDEKDAGTLGEDETAAELHSKHLQEKSGDSNLITDEDIAAQAFIFFFAGFETVSTVLSFTAHELAVNPDIQERLRDEIDACILNNGGRLTYEGIQGMKYLDMVLCESLRKYPPAGFTDRTCTKSFKVAQTDLVIEEGSIIMIPMFPIQRDPQYFPDPEKFDPERFSEENKANIRPYSYLPFGSGPHNCIGMRFALLETKLALCYMLATCDLQVTSKTQIPLQIATNSVQMTTDAGFWIAAVPRETPTISLD